jgi:hypothetical protein
MQLLSRHGEASSVLTETGAGQGVRWVMSHYSNSIDDRTRCDSATAVLLEELMRGERTGLDGLTLAEFDTAIVQALADAAELAQSGLLAGYCSALGIETPRNGALVHQ